MLEKKGIKNLYNNYKKFEIMTYYILGVTLLVNIVKNIFLKFI
jgi:hypothetical protein